MTPPHFPKKTLKKVFPKLYGVLEKITKYTGASLSQTFSAFLSAVNHPTQLCFDAEAYFGTISTSLFLFSVVASGSRKGTVHDWFDDALHAYQNELKEAHDKSISFYKKNKKDHYIALRKASRESDNGKTFVPDEPDLPPYPQIHDTSPSTEAVGKAFTFGRGHFSIINEDAISFTKDHSIRGEDGKSKFFGQAARAKARKFVPNLRVSDFTLEKLENRKGIVKSKIAFSLNLCLQANVAKDFFKDGLALSQGFQGRCLFNIEPEAAQREGVVIHCKEEETSLKQWVTSKISAIYEKVLYKDVHTDRCSLVFRKMNIKDEDMDVQEAFANFWIKQYNQNGYYNEDIKTFTNRSIEHLLGIGASLQAFRCPNSKTIDRDILILSTRLFNYYCWNFYQSVLQFCPKIFNKKDTDQKDGGIDLEKFMVYLQKAVCKKYGSLPNSFKMTTTMMRPVTRHYSRKEPLREALTTAVEAELLSFDSFQGQYSFTGKTLNEEVDPFPEFIFEGSEEGDDNKPEKNIELIAPSLEDDGIISLEREPLEGETLSPINKGEQDIKAYFESKNYSFARDRENKEWRSVCPFCPSNLRNKKQLSFAVNSNDDYAVCYLCKVRGSLDALRAKYEENHPFQEALSTNVPIHIQSSIPEFSKDDFYGEDPIVVALPPGNVNMPPFSHNTDRILVEDFKKDHSIKTYLESKGIKLKKAGDEYVCLCPFHNERTPSFTISEKKGAAYCFGCGFGGDVIRVIEKYENKTFLEVLEGDYIQSSEPTSLLALTEEDKTPEEKKKKATVLYESGLSGAIPGEAHYFENRNVVPSSNSKFRKETYSSEGKSYPAILHPIVSLESGEQIATHATFLTPDLGFNAKDSKEKSFRNIFGSYKGGCIVLRQGSDLERLVMTEGIEDGLSLEPLGVLKSTCFENATIIASVTAGNMKDVILPPLVKSVLIAADRDEHKRGESEALKATQKLSDRSVEVFTIFPKEGCKDFNEELMGSLSRPKG